MVRVLKQLNSVFACIVALSSAASLNPVLPVQAQEKSEDILEVDPGNSGWYYLRTNDALKLKYTEDWYKDVRLEYVVNWYGLSENTVDLDDQGVLHAIRAGEYQIGYDFTYTQETWQRLSEKYPDENLAIPDIGRSMHFVVSDDPYVFRLYNPYSGEHFYTVNQSERRLLMNLGWTSEGYGWFASDSSQTPVYRLYDPNAGDHHFTMDQNEYEALALAGWKQEGVAWYCNPKTDIPVYRQYNPNAQTGRHNYTASQGEKDHLVSLGWKDEGIAWYSPSLTE